MDITLNKVEIIKKLNKQAFFSPDTFHELESLIKKRKIVARKLMREEKDKSAKEMLEYLNLKIKELLAL
jgi:ribosomal protein S15P/S13E